MPSMDVYTLRTRAIISTAITVLQLKAGANNGFEIVRGSLTQYGSTTSDQEEIALVRKSVGATVTQAVIGGSGGTLFYRDPNESTPSLSLGTTATGVIATGEGTDSDYVLREAFNVLNGWVYLPVPEERIYVPPAGIIGLKFIVAPASQTWDAELVIREM
jgi:hypothetical protein